MKKLFILLATLFSIIGNAQTVMIGGVINPPPPVESCGSPVVMGEIIRDNFDGSSLSGSWTVLGSPTITVSGGRLRLQGGLGTTKDLTQMLKYTAYATNGVSTLRNYTVKLDSITFNSVSSANDKGPAVGVEPRANDANLAASWANVDPSNVDSIEILQTDQFHRVGNTARTASGLPSINTTDLYRLELIEYEDTITCTLTNISAATSASVKYAWNTITSSPRRPNILTFSMGVCGSSDFYVSSFSVTTTEHKDLKVLVPGNSIATGYSTNSFLNSFAYQLRTNTACTVEVAAGPGNGVNDFYTDRFEIIARNPAYLICELGTNDGAHGGGQTTYQLAITAIHAALPSCQIYLMTIPNGEDPATGGTFNNSLYSFTGIAGVIDTWSGPKGWGAMLGNPVYMYDTLHPTTAGHRNLADLIKAALPSVFPLFILPIFGFRRRKDGIIELKKAA